MKQKNVHLAPENTFAERSNRFKDFQIDSEKWKAKVKQEFLRLLLRFNNAHAYGEPLDSPFWLPLTLGWVQGHNRIEGNEKSDQLAKSGVLISSIGVELILEASPSFFEDFINGTNLV